MSKFIAREKLSKKARKELDSQRRTLWEVPPITKRIESKKRYDCKRKQYLNRDDFGTASFFQSGETCHEKAYTFLSKTGIIVSSDFAQAIRRPFV